MRTRLPGAASVAVVAVRLPPPARVRFLGFFPSEFEFFSCRVRVGGPTYRFVRAWLICCIGRSTGISSYIELPGGDELRPAHPSCDPTSPKRAAPSELHTSRLWPCKPVHVGTWLRQFPTPVADDHLKKQRSGIGWEGCAGCEGGECAACAHGSPGTNCPQSQSSSSHPYSESINRPRSLLALVPEHSTDPWICTYPSGLPVEPRQVL